MNFSFFKTNLIGLIVVSALFLSACKNNEAPQPAKGTIQFSFNTPSSGSSARVQSSGAISAMVVTIKDASGNIIYNRKKLDVFSLSGEYISDPLELSVGNFSLTEFLVVDQYDTTLYATPLEGSALAYLVKDPAPIAFNITKDNTTKLAPEVLAASSGSAASFGYATFGLNVVPTISFSVAVFVYSDTLKNFVLTSAHLSVAASDSSSFAKDLYATTSTVLARKTNTYQVTISKSGYASYTRTFSQAELVAFTPSAALIVKLFPSSLSSGLLIWYPFSGSAQDSSGNAQHGTVVGASLTSGRNGVANTAYLFNGSNYISVPSSLLKLSTYTYATWASATALPAYGNPELLFEVGEVSTSYNQSLSLCNHYANADYVGWGGGSYNASPVVSATGVTTNILPNTNQWYHIAIVRSATSVTLYINGQLATTATVAGGYAPLYGATNVANIGININHIEGFTGKIDDFKIYNRALSASEVANLYAQ